MKKVTSLFAATLLATGLTTAAVTAGEYEHGGAAGAGSASQAPSSSATTGSGSLAGQQFEHQHMMTGTIEELDQQEGKLTLKTIDGKTMELYFPPSALTAYKEGDQVAVQLGISQQTGAASMTGSTSSSAGTAGSTGSLSSEPTGADE